MALLTTGCHSCHSPSLQLGQHGTKGLQAESGLIGSRKKNKNSFFVNFKEVFLKPTHFGRAKREANSSLEVGNSSGSGKQVAWRKTRKEENKRGWSTIPSSLLFCRASKVRTISLKLTISTSQHLAPYRGKLYAVHMQAVSEPEVVSFILQKYINLPSLNLMCWVVLIRKQICNANNPAVPLMWSQSSNWTC